MYVDAKSLLAETQNVFGTGTTTLSENVIDLGVAAPADQGSGEQIHLVIQVTTAFSGGTSVNFTLASDAAAAIATDGSASEHISTGAIPVADLPIGTQISLALPSLSVQEYERYLGLLVTTVGAVAAGAITAFLTHTPDTWKALPDAVN